MDEDRTYLNTIIHIRDGFEKNLPMSESMSELEKERMLDIFKYLETHEKICSAQAAELLNIEVKTAGRLLAKALKIGLVEGEGRTKNKSYHRK